MTVRPGIAAGVAAGAVGTVALNTVTYLDMLVRGRPASNVPADAARKLLAGVYLGDDDTAPSRQEALGALLGVVTGLGVGAIYGLIRSRVYVPSPAADLCLAAGVMMGSDLPLTALGLTDPRRWDATGWAADLLPHLAYGVAASAAYRVLDG